MGLAPQLARAPLPAPKAQTLPRAGQGRTPATSAPLARNQGAHAPPGLPLVSPLVRETNGMAPLPGSGLLANRERGPHPGRARLHRSPVELRWEGLNHKGPRTSVGAPTRGRARPCGGFHYRQRVNFASARATSPLTTRRMWTWSLRPTNRFDHFDLCQTEKLLLRLDL